MKVKLIVEDHYGGEFFLNLIPQLKDNGLINEKLKLSKPKHLSALCNSKLTSILKIFDSECDKIIIILDSDGPKNYDKRYAMTQIHIPDNMKTPVKIVMMDYEIEEWICISKNVKWGHKPSEELKIKFGYRKSSLPKYVDKLDFKKLLENCNSFTTFINALH